MPTPLTKRERAIARTFARYEKLQEKASAAYARADRLATELAQKIFKIKNARALNEFTKAVRISEEGKHLLAEAQFLAAQKDALNGGDGKIWAHGAVRPWKLSTKNLD